MNSQAIIMAIPGLIISILCIACLWKIFVKAGKPGWFSIIPVLNFITLYQIAGAIIVLVANLAASVVFARICTIESDICLIGSFVCLFITIATSFIFPIKLAKKFGKGIGFAILLIVFPIIGYSMLAFGKSQYIGKAEPQEDTEEYDQEVPQEDNQEIQEEEEDLSEFTNENYVPEEDEENTELPTEEENTEIEDLDDKEFIDPPVTIQDEEPQVVDVDNEEDNSIKEENNVVDTIEQEEADEDDEPQDEDSDLETKEIEF